MALKYKIGWLIYVLKKKSSDLSKEQRLSLDFLEFCGIVTNSLKSLKKNGGFHLSSMKVSIF